MGQTEATRQSDNILPPRKSKILALAVDATSRPYDLRTIAFGAAWRADNDDVYVTLLADGGDVYVAFDSATLTVDDTAAVAAGGTIAFAATYCFVVKSGTGANFRIRRNLDQWMAVKTSSGTATLRMYASSPSTVPGQVV